MREIKFRAWDKTHRIWWYLELIDGSRRLHYSHSSPHPYSAPGELMSWQAYAGLKDKNGKEIYEGDIVKFWWQSIYGEREIIDRRFEVVFEHGRFLQSEKGNAPHDLWYNWDELEVVGNIYENPELLQ